MVGGVNPLRASTRLRLFLAATSALPALFSRATDLRLDVATYNNSGDDTDWFGDAQMQYLNFPSANGHSIEQGGSTHQGLLTQQANTLGVYYDTFHSLYSPTETPAAAVSTIQNWIKSNFGGSTETNTWLVLNEVDGSTWNGTSGAAYRTWLVDTMSALHSAGYNKIILYSSDSLAGSSTSSTWKQIAQYAYLGTESFVDGQVVVSDNFSVSKLQSIYQQRYDNWTKLAGIPASDLIAGEHFSVNKYDPSYYWGADGISGTQWQMAIEARDIAIHNIPFAGFIGYAWDKDAQATGVPATDLAAQISYEKAYASTLVTQSELPAWTNNDGTGSWNDYLNWTGGLPSTTAAPFPLLAATNPNLPKQTAANFLANATRQNTTITLDGDQSITNLTFGSNWCYTIAQGGGGSLTITGTNPWINVTTGSHFITAPIVFGNNTALNLTGNLYLQGSIANNGFTLTKSGPGALTIQGAQTNAANSTIAMNGGALYLYTDAGSASSAPLALTATAGITFFKSSQHLASLSLNGGNVMMAMEHCYLSTRSLSVTGSGQFDVNENDVIDHYSGNTPYSTIESEIASGYNGGGWNGKGIVTSGAKNHPYSNLAAAEASQVYNLTGSQTATFDGQTVDATSLLIKYTWDGDANMDGVVNAADLAQMQMGGTTWWQGDFNHDGIVNQADFDLYYQGLAASGGVNISTVAPEPVTLGWLLLVPVVSRRRTSRR